MNEGVEAGEWRTVPAGKRGHGSHSGDVVDGGIEEAVVEGRAIGEASVDTMEGCRVVNQVVETDKQSNGESGRGNIMYDTDVCKAAGQYRKQDECRNDKANINREHNGNNRRGDRGDQREVSEYQGYVSLDSVVRREAHEVAHDIEAEGDIRSVVTRGLGQYGRVCMKEIGSWFRGCKSRQALDRIRNKHGSLRKFLQKEQGLLVYTDQHENWWGPGIYGTSGIGAAGYHTERALER